MKPIEYLENKLNHIEEQLKETRVEFNNIDFIDKGYNLNQLLRSRSYRLEVAIKEVKTNAHIAKLLNMTERSVYRLRKLYNL